MANALSSCPVRELIDLFLGVGRLRIGWSCRLGRYSAPKGLLSDASCHCQASARRPGPRSAQEKPRLLRAGLSSDRVTDTGDAAVAA